jgi:hypothetical protein
MELIERYLQSIGRHLPRRQRRDILSELRSSLMDTLEARFGGTYSDDDVAQVIKEMGPPQKVAASYDAEGQYLIGPTLFPTFKLVLGIVLAAVIGGQLVALLVGVVFGERTVSGPEELAVIANSLPAAFGMVALVFAILQRYGVQPELNKEEAFDPRKLPALETEAPVKRGEQIVSIVMGAVVLALVAQYTLRGGFVGADLFDNPVVDRYFFWIALSIVIGIMLDAWLLWQGRWTPLTRLAKIGSEVFSLVVLGLLIQGHTAWLNARGVSGFFDSVSRLAPYTSETAQLFGMAAFRMGLTVAFIVTAVDAGVQVFRLIKAGLVRSEVQPLAVK